MPESVIPTLHMIDLPAAFADTMMSFLRKDEWISFPEIAVTLTTFVGWWDLLPKLATSCFTAIPNDKGHDLASSATHDRPNPAFVPSFINK